LIQDVSRKEEEMNGVTFDLYHEVGIPIKDGRIRREHLVELPKNPEAPLHGGAK